VRYVRAGNVRVVDALSVEELSYRSELDARVLTPRRLVEARLGRFCRIPALGPQMTAGRRFQPSRVRSHRAGRARSSNQVSSLHAENDLASLRSALVEVEATSIPCRLPFVAPGNTRANQTKSPCLELERVFSGEHSRVIFCRRLADDPISLSDLLAIATNEWCLIRPMERWVMSIPIQRRSISCAASIVVPHPE